MIRTQVVENLPVTLRLVFALLVGSVACCLEAASPLEVTSSLEATTHNVTCDGIVFTLPEGLTVTKVAGSDIVKWPIVADWDSSGRLVVAESGGVGWPIQEHNQQQLHRIVRLVDRDKDGEFDERLVAADGLAFPEGVLCIGDDLFVAAPPVIWRLIDADGDGRCERREVWFDGTTITNCANDLHGPYLGRDGWIYWCKGAFGEQTHSLLDGRTLRSSAAHIYRRRLEGGPIEPLISGGMDNPVEVAFLASGDKFFTSTFLHHPSDDLRDGIGHAVYGSVFGKDHRVIDGLTRTGALMKPTIELGPAAPSGLLTASATCKANFGVDHQSPMLVSALFNLHKLMIHRLSESGSSYQSVDSDLVRTDRADFHPTDVIEDGRGNLLLVDTGGWYDLCCPTSRVDQQTAPGGIYRVGPAHVDASVSPASDQPRTISWDRLEPRELFERFGDGRPWVRRSARLRFSQLGDRAIPVCRSISGDPRQSLDARRSAIWALCRIDSRASARALVERLEEQPPAALRLPILHSIALRKITDARRAVEENLQHPSLAVRRVAAQALGRIAGPDEVRPLLDSMAGATQDSQLKHALIYGLIEIGRRHESIEFVAQADGDAALLAALVATRELGRAKELDPDFLVTCLDRDDAQLRSISLSLLSERPEAATSMLDRLQSVWEAFDTEQRDPPKFFSVLVERWRDESVIRDWINDRYSEASQQRLVRQLFLAEHLNRFYPLNAGEGRSQVIVDWLQAAEVRVQRRLLVSLRDAEISTVDRTLESALMQRAISASDSERLEWLSALPRVTDVAHPELGKTIVGAVVQEEATRAWMAANVLDRVRLDEASARRLLDSIEHVQAKHLPNVIEALLRSGDDEFQVEALVRLKELPAARTLRDDYLPMLVRKSDATVRRTAKEVTESLVQPTDDIQNAVDEVLAKLPAGDPVRGLQVFRGSKAACSSCHRMGYIGKNVGPVLTKIGQSRTTEALLEAILFPSSRLEQSYQSTKLLTIDGQVYNGLVEFRDGDQLKMRTGADRVVTVQIADIEREDVSDVSIMPKGIRELLSDQELADLLALLQAAK